MTSNLGCVVLLPGLYALGQPFVQGDALRERYMLGGLGVVGREIAGETDCRTNAYGHRVVSLLDRVDGRAAARLEWRVHDYSCGAFLVRDNKTEKLYRGWDLPEISYESIGLVYYEHRNGFARVLERTVPPGVWVRVADVPGGRLRPWAELLVESRHTYRGYNGRTLHERPSERSPAIVNLRERVVHDSRVHQLIPTGALSGQWGEFDVIEFNTDFSVMTRTSETAPTGRRWKGWLRVVNSAGAPEFWFVTRD